MPFGNGSTCRMALGSKARSAARRAAALFGAGFGAERGGAPSALWSAAYYGEEECVALLLSAGAAVDLANFNGTTPLFVACQGGHVGCARRLIAAGADVNRLSRKGIGSALVAATVGTLPLRVAAWTRVPYLSSGTTEQTYYHLDDALLVLRRTAPMNYISSDLQY